MVSHPVRPAGAARPSPAPDAELTEALAVVDLAELGSRLKRARVALRRTQSQVTSGQISTAYLSRIEAGTRRPTLEVLKALAERLDSSVHELLLGLAPASWSAMQAELEWAQLSLRTGDAAAALTRTTALVAALPEGTRLRRAALGTHALALEGNGDYEQAAAILEELVEVVDGPPGLEDLMALCRVYRQAGELGRALEVGERADRHIAELGLQGTPEAIKLTLTVAAAHTEAGSFGYAARMCQRALRHAENLRTPGERAGCYWNASVIESKRGHHAEAVALGQRALHILDEADSARMTSRLRTQLGIMQLRVDEPSVPEALANLRQAETELRTSDASPADLASNRLGQARAHFLVGELEQAAADARDCLADMSRHAPLTRAEAYVLLGQIAFHEGDHERARSLYAEAILELSAVGADRAAAQLWFELGGLWLSVGCQAEALDAFQRAGASSGLRSLDPAAPLAPARRRAPSRA